MDVETIISLNHCLDIPYTHLQTSTQHFHCLLDGDQCKSMDKAILGVVIQNKSFAVNQSNGEMLRKYISSWWWPFILIEVG